MAYCSCGGIWNCFRLKSNPSRLRSVHPAAVAVALFSEDIPPPRMAHPRPQCPQFRGNYGGGDFLCCVVMCYALLCYMYRCRIFGLKCCTSAADGTLPLADGTLPAQSARPRHRSENHPPDNNVCLWRKISGAWY